MYGGYTEEDTYCDTLVDTASVGEDSGESDIDDLETRLYSQIHYGEPMLNDGEISSEPVTDLSTQEKEKQTEKTGSQLLSEFCSASLPSTSCQAKNGNLSNEPDSGTNTCEKIPESDKSQDTIVIADSSALSADDNTVESRDLSVIDRHGTTTDIMPKDRINSKRRKIEYILVDTESDGAKPEKKKLKDILHKNTNTKAQRYDVDTLDSDSDTSVVEITSDKKVVEYVSLITDDERYQEDISVHASFGSESVMEGESAGHQSGDTTLLGNTGIDVEQSTLEEVLESLGDCDWSSKPEHRPVFIKQRGRYYQSKKCEKCGGKGHQSRDCPKKIMVCLQCGEKGHMCKSCPRPVCFNCFNLGHTRNDCREPRRVRWKKCSRCQMQGHKEVECPNRWRQFHLTTNLEEPVHGENTENDYVYCSNCGKEGHFYHDCIENTMFGNQWETWPFIVGYTLDREMDSLLNWRDECTPGNNDQPSVRKGKSKKKPQKPHRSETTVNMLDSRTVKNKGKKRKWKEHDEPTEHMPGTSRGKKPKLEPHVKKKGKRKHQAEQNEGVDCMERGSYDDVGNDTVPRVVVQAYNSNRSHGEQKKKRKKKKKSTYNEEGGKGMDARYTKKKRTPNKQYQQISNNSNSTRGFRYGQGAEVSHASHSARHWDDERFGKSRKKRDKRRDKGGGGGGGYGHRQNGYWEGENSRQGRKRQF